MPNPTPSLDSACTVILETCQFGPKEKALLQDILIEFREYGEREFSMEQTMLLSNITAIAEGRTPPYPHS